MKKTLLYSILVALLAAAAWFAWQKKTQTGTAQKADMMFAVRDTATIDKIFIAHKDGRRNLLERASRTVWMLNKTIVASPVLVNHLLEVIRDVDVQRPCLEAEKKVVLNQLAGEHIKVEVYNQGTMSRSYYIGLTTVDHLGNYFMMTDAEEPYVCHIPGFEGYLDIRYRIDSLGWRTPQAYFGNSKSLQHVELEEAGKPVLDLAKQGGSWLAGGMAPNANKLDQYLARFNGLFIGNWKNNRGFALSDSLARHPMSMRLRLTDADPRQNVELRFYDNTENHWLVVVMPRGAVAEASKPLMAPLLVKNELLK